MDQETPSTVPPTPSSTPSFPWPIVAFLILAIAGGAGAVAIQWNARQKQEAALQSAAASSHGSLAAVPRSLENGAVEPDQLNTTTAWVVSGEGDRVVIYGVLGDCDGHRQLRDLLTKFGEEHSSQAKVVLFGLGTPEGQRAIGSTCAGYVVTSRDAGGVLRPLATFQKAPGTGWTVEDVLAAANDALSGAAEAGESPESTSESAPEETGDLTAQQT